jgi:hypothetical protein
VAWTSRLGDYRPNFRPTDSAATLSTAGGRGSRRGGKLHRVCARSPFVLKSASQLGRSKTRHSAARYEGNDMPHRLHTGLIVAALLAFPAIAQAETSPAAKPADAPPPPATAAQPPAAPAVTAHVDGFRSAKWGMAEAQVRAAVHSDFNISDDKIKGSDNLAEKTQAVTVSVPDLVEGAGTANVSYVFGYTSKKLIQVNILWSTGLDPQATPQKIVAAADQLRVLLLGSGYDAKTVTANTRMPDGSVLVFQGQDADKHTTVLHLTTGSVTPTDKDGKPGKPVDVATLALSYVLDAAQPDVFRLKKGSF